MLRYGQEQIEEAENIIDGISPRTGTAIGQLARLKEIRRRIEDERRGVEAQLHASKGASA